MKYLMPTQTQMWPMHFQTLWSGNVRKNDYSICKMWPMLDWGFPWDKGKGDKDTYQL